MANPESNEAISQRLNLLRLASGETQTQFAARLGISLPRWNNMERGSPLSKEVALMIVRSTDITLDWLFLGKTSGLTLKRLQELEAAADLDLHKAG
jgi:transcriptional regulator with XRE-family HTH domain